MEEDVGPLPVEQLRAALNPDEDDDESVVSGFEYPYISTPFPTTSTWTAEGCWPAKRSPRAFITFFLRSIRTHSCSASVQGTHGSPP